MNAVTAGAISALESLELDVTPAGAAVPLCPYWCEKEAGHEYDSSDYDDSRFGSFGDSIVAGELMVYRYHLAEQRGTERETISVRQLEAAAVSRQTAPVVTLSPASVYVYLALDDEMTARDAADLGRDYLRSADLLKRIDADAGLIARAADLLRAGDMTGALRTLAGGSQ